MNQLNNKTALVTGGSRGLGRGIVEALAAKGAQVWALARDTEKLDLLKREVPSVQTRAADVTQPQVAVQSLKEIQPDILILNAGATPTVEPIHKQTWEQFSQAWETDVKSTFEFGRQALLMPLKPGSVVIIMSSGAALSGSLLSGGYAGAKRTQWFMAQYLQAESNAQGLGLRCIALVPRQIVGATALGHQAAAAYAAHAGITEQAYLDRMGPALTPQAIGQGVVSLLTEEAYKEGIAYGINSQGLSALS
jgi:NAD(P)-dependent dehydrogenase (short-subunit alcohol dehydrogenase family)